MYVYNHTYSYTQIFVFLKESVELFCKSTHSYSYTYMKVYIHVYIHIYVYVYIHKYMCVYIYIYIYIHVYICTYFIDMIRTNHLDFHIHTFYTPTVLSLSFYIYLYFIFIIFYSHHHSTLLEYNFYNVILICLIGWVNINTCFLSHSSKESNHCLQMLCFTCIQVQVMTRNPHTPSKFEAETVLRFTVFYPNQIIFLCDCDVKLRGWRKKKPPQK
jgi:hypothetical protein